MNLPVSTEKKFQKHKIVIYIGIISNAFVGSWSFDNSKTWTNLQVENFL